MKTFRRYLAVLMLMMISIPSLCQQKNPVAASRDTVAAAGKTKLPADTVASGPAKRVFNPRTAAIRSAILPGLGQVYNKKYWKLPLVYGALGTTALVFKFNLTEYNRIRYAYKVLVNKDTANYKNVGVDLQPFLQYNALQDLRSARNEYRKNIDYSVLVFLLFWALNVVDATVDAHLKGFDVSSDLSLKIKPNLSTGINTPGLSFIFDLHKGKHPLLVLP